MITLRNYLITQTNPVCKFCIVLSVFERNEAECYRFDVQIDHHEYCICVYDYSHVTIM